MLQTGNLMSCGSAVSQINGLGGPDEPEACCCRMLGKINFYLGPCKCIWSIYIDSYSSIELLETEIWLQYRLRY